MLIARWTENVKYVIQQWVLLSAKDSSGWLSSLVSKALTNCTSWYRMQCTHLHGQKQV